ncbi:PIN domain-containing protein [Agrobacterium pusense]|uniref:PIN-like domain-containing protein n=1 Tax=Agrobacterium pusense TaxID=648995 RepID=UPI002867ED3F|nr:PIN domain-containing protein [Agrobacterium pusense]WMW56484.1 PIN domain-containing protein [Agrobacterium pusense]
MTAPKEAKPQKAASTDNLIAGFDPFKLENSFEDVSQIFKPNKVAKASNKDVLISVDTNVLLLPYTLRKDGLSTLQKFYQDLRSANRLFLPARVAREFITNRDKKLAELLKTLGEVKSRINIGEKKLSPILDGVDGSEEMATASQTLKDAKKRYTTAIEKVEAQVQSWSGDDPITSIYDSVFDAANIISPTDTNADMLVEWQKRLTNKVPPGYKDGSKEDTGIGDFLVWKSLLALGASQKKDLIFVTGEEKADWFVRLNGQGVYPRPELVAEYKKHSGGKNIRLVEFHEVLSEMEVPQDFVNLIESAETAANNVIRSSLFDVGTGFTPKLQARAALGETDVASFRMRYGGQNIAFVAADTRFEFSVSEKGKDSLWAYPNGKDQLTVLPVISAGQYLDSRAILGAQSAVSVSKGQMIWMKDALGFMLIATLLETNAPMPNEMFEVKFVFTILPPGDTFILPQHTPFFS